MAHVPDQIRNNIIKNTVHLTRYGAGLDDRIQELVTELGQELVKNLLGAGLDTPNTAWQRSHMEALLKEAKATIYSAYSDIGEFHAEEMSGLVQVSGKAITTAMNDAFGADLMVPPKWTKEQLRAIASDTLIDGAPSSVWWDRQAEDAMQDFADSMRKGMLRGENIAQLRDRIMGQDLPGVNAVGKVDLRTVPTVYRAVVKTARRNAEALVRTSVIATANSAHLEAFQANADILDGIEWLSTLDNRTTPECRALDGLRWTMDLEPIGHDHPYPGATAHWGCRSTTLPCTKSWEQLAREAHGNSTLAKELDKMPVGNRASMGGPVSGSINYKQWFDQQAPELQAEIMGPGKLGEQKLALYQRGKLDFTDMLNQKNNTLSLKALRALVN